jgi:hypothetical protein
MRGTFVQRDVNAPLALRAAGAEPITGTLFEVRVHAHAHGERWIVLHVAIDLVTFQRIEDEGLAGFVPGSIAPGMTGYALVSTAPIEIQLRLEGEAAEAIQAGPLEAVLERVVGGLAEADGPLHDTAIYRWLTVMQETPTRPGVTARRGFHSIYA